MTANQICSGVLLDDEALTVEEIAIACRVDRAWITERVEAGLLDAVTVTGQWRFQSAQLIRARRMRDTERMFEANQELAALVADLLEELDRLRSELPGSAGRR